MVTVPDDRSQDKCDHWYGGLQSRRVGSVARVAEADEEEEGVRVEPAEIEQVSLRFPGVKEKSRGRKE